MKLLESIDVYGMKFNFLICKHYRFHSIFSEIFSVLLFVLTLFYAFFLSTDFFFRKNPRTIQEKSSRETEQRINLTNEIYSAMWRIEDENGNKINFDNYIYPVLFYVDEEGKRTIIENNNYNYKCKNENAFITNFNNSFDDYYCFNWNNQTFGDNFYFQFGLYYCKEGKHFSNNSNCPEKSKIPGDKIYYLTVLIPYFNFLPENKTPFQIKYTKHYIILSHSLVRIDQVLIHNNIINDDSNYLFSVEHIKNIWATSSLLTYYNYKDINFYGVDGVSSEIYTMTFTMDKEYTYYKRYYMKFSEALSLTATYVKITYLIMKVIVIFINKYMFFDRLSSYSFSFPNLTKTKDKGCFINRPIINRNNTTIVSELSKLESKTFNNFFYSKKKIRCSNKSVASSIDTSSTTLPKVKKITNYKFGICFLIRNSIYTSKRDNKRMSFFAKAKHVLIKRLDLIMYLRKISEFNIIKKCILDPVQFKAFKFFKKKEIILSHSEKNRLNDLKDVFEYYQMNKNKDDLINQQIINNIDDNVKCL